MRVWLALAILVLGIAAARAIPPSDQIIIFGKGSSASGGGTACTNRLDFSVACNSQYIAVVH